MTVHVEGENINDVRSKCSLGWSEHPWVSIEQLSREYGRELKLGFKVRWRGLNENFTREVGSYNELLSVLRPIFKAHEKKVIAEIQTKQKALEKEQAKLLKEARAAVKKLETK